LEIRVCHVTTGHGLTDDRIFHKEALSLSDRGYRVFVLGPSEGVKSELSGIGLEPIRSSHIRWRIARKLLLLSRIKLRLLRLRCHVYHCHEMDAVLAALPCVLFGSRIVYDVHEHFPDNLRDHLAGPWLVLLRVLDKLLSRVVHMVITVDEILARKYRLARRVIVIHNYPKLESYASAGSSGDADLAVYVGGLSEERGVWEMVEGLERARKEYSGLKLLMVGRFIPDSLKEEVEARVRELALSDAIEIVDWVPFERIPEVVKRASIGLSFLRDLPRYRLAVPIKVYEYMAAGIPVIASEFEVVSHLLRKERCGLTAVPGSGASLCEVLLTLVRDRAAAEAMGKQGRRAVEREFNWERESKVLLGGYERLFQVP
jgi:glycosyltransferase involved in cell wall biosynthesis